MKRSIITIDHQKCNGCGKCIPNCPEGAIQIIDGKARLVSDLMCDGLGACMGHCPENAITIEQRNAEPYDEYRVMENIVKQGENTVKAHIQHLVEHNQQDFYEQAIQYLEEHDYPIPSIENQPVYGEPSSGCPGMRTHTLTSNQNSSADQSGKRVSQLTHWPIQMHLISPTAAHYQKSDMILAADCVAFSIGDFHKDHLKGKTIGIACPKLDNGQEIYLEKLKALIDIAKINTLTVIIMQVPCCSGLLQCAKKAVSMAQRKIPIKCIMVSLQGQIISEEWIDVR